MRGIFRRPGWRLLVPVGIAMTLVIAAFGHAPALAGGSCETASGAAVDSGAAHPENPDILWSDGVWRLAETVRDEKAREREQHKTAARDARREQQAAAQQLEMLRIGAVLLAVACGAAAVLLARAPELRRRILARLPAWDPLRWLAVAWIFGVPAVLWLFGVVIGLSCTASDPPRNCYGGIHWLGIIIWGGIAWFVGMATIAVLAAAQRWQRPPSHHGG